MKPLTVLERVLLLMPKHGETPAEFTARSERLRKKWLAARDV